MKHSATLQFLREDYSFTYPTLSVAKYSSIQLSGLWLSGINEITQVSKQQQEDSKPGSLDRESDVLTLAPPCSMPICYPVLLRHS